MKIPHFRGVFSKDRMPVRCKLKESAIVNLGSSHSNGTHWVGYKKNGSQVKYFDSFGNLPPPNELQKYFNGYNVKYNYDKYQKFNTSICGQLCLKFLWKA